MSAILDASLEILSGYDKVSATNKKRWHMAFTTIYCSRAFLSPFKHQYSSLLTNIPINSSHNSHSSSRFVIDVVEYHPFLDHSILKNLVKEKSVDQLAKLGGVDGVSTSLRTDQQSGISGDEEDIASRYAAFGTNTYPKPPTKTFFHFVWEAFQVIDLIKYY